MEGLYYDHQILVNSRDVDGQGHCRPSALLGHLQEAATLAAEAGGFGRARLLKEYRAFWMLARIWFHLDRPLRWNEPAAVRTWHRGGKGALMYRDFDLFAGGERIGEAVSAWVLADLDSHRLLRLSGIAALDGTSGGSLCKDKSLVKLRLPQGMERTERRKMRYSDTDINGHVNNTRYADFACDALELERRPEGVFVSDIQLGYTAESRAEEELVLLTCSEEGAAFVKGVDDAGKTRFEAQLNFAKCFLDKGLDAGVK